MTTVSASKKGYSPASVRDTAPAPNPVRTFVTLRTLQVCTPALLGLLTAASFVPTRQLLPLIPLMGATVAGGLSLYFRAVFHHRTRWGYPLQTTLPETTGNAVALTFDDGPHPATTPDLLDTLSRFGARATFFVVAERAREFPDLVREIERQGHTIGLHGLRHRAMVGQKASVVRRELAEAERILCEILGKPLQPRLLRPPHGFKTPTLCRIACRAGWTLVSWSNDPHDYDSISAESLLARCVNGIEARDIVLLHERPHSPTANIMLPELLTCLRQRHLQPIAL
ncbi:MAG: hypothetical protein OHK0029_12890 [Armatimonadaceae bacterium]